MHQSMPAIRTTVVTVECQTGNSARFSLLVAIIGPALDRQCAGISDFLERKTYFQALHFLFSHTYPSCQLGIIVDIDILFFFVLRFG